MPAQKTRQDEVRNQLAMQYSSLPPGHAGIAQSASVATPGVLLNQNQDQPNAVASRQQPYAPRQEQHAAAAAAAEVSVSSKQPTTALQAGTGGMQLLLPHQASLGQQEVHCPGLQVQQLQPQRPVLQPVEQTRPPAQQQLLARATALNMNQADQLKLPGSQFTQSDLLAGLGQLQNKALQKVSSSEDTAGAGAGTGRGASVAAQEAVSLDSLMAVLFPGRQSQV